MNIENTSIGKLAIGKNETFDPRSKSVPDMLTTKQTGMIFALAGKAGVDAHKVCAELFECAIHELSKQAASILIDRLDKMPKADRPQKAKVNFPPAKSQLDLFSLADPEPDEKTSPTDPNFEPVYKRAAFADPVNPLVILAQEILANCGVRQTAKNSYVVNSLEQSGIEEFSVMTGNTGGPKCDCPNFIRKAPLSVGGKFRCEHIIAAHLFYREICEAMKS